MSSATSSPDGGGGSASPASPGSPCKAVLGFLDRLGSSITSLFCQKGRYTSAPISAEQVEDDDVVAERRHRPAHAARAPEDAARAGARDLC